MRSIRARDGYALLTTVLYVFVFYVFIFKDIIGYCSFYSVCNTDGTDVCAIKIAYLLTVLLLKAKVKFWNVYIAAYMSQTQDQQHFTIQSWKR